MLKISVFLLGMNFLLISDSSIAQPFRVVLDPGHGGSDEGTVYFEGEKRFAEKDLTLTLAKMIKLQLKKKGYFVHLTRRSDVEVLLPDRTAFANRLKADAFISIHLNSAFGKSQSDAQGIETYILNNATNASSHRLAQLENTVISQQLTDTTEQLDVALILKDLQIDGNLSESKRLACDVQNQLVALSSLSTSQKTSKRKLNRGVKQALFHVLLGADMPSILVEAGFLSHPHDRAFLTSLQGQKLISRAITIAIDHYRKARDLPRQSGLISKCKVS